MAQVLMTGDRPSGKLHLGHYVGSLQNRVALQQQYESYIMIADVQALTDNFENPGLVEKSVYEIAAGYLSVGIDPSVATIYLQSQIPETTELTLYFMNLVTLSRLERNPTVKTELAQKNMEESIPVGFLCYPINQAADITILQAEVIPVGEDQIPMIEQTNEIVRKFNRLYGEGTLKECKVHLGKTGRLPGIDGKGKASKSLGNAIFLSDAPSEVREKVWDMFTDPNHVKISDPGQVEGNVVFTYLDAFHDDKDELTHLKQQYRKGGLGDVTIKTLLVKDLEQLLEPIRAKRATLTQEILRDVLRDGSQKARAKAQQTMKLVRNAMGLNYF
ncbi:tryptophan--tRNA ligase [Alphaproteobacteria bacterium]|nr:tryptophan--tRNA ligase [Alphaproteobacteria bacterium]